jgi:hypothetical protein
MTTSFEQLEAEFQRTLQQYKSTYKDYLLELNNQMGKYWNTEENVTVSNRLDSAKIPFLTDPNIKKEDCLHACASDPKCKFVLFSDSGNGECAANQCLKWTKDAGKLIKDANGKGTLMKNKACVPGKGPAETSYIYSGWEKPNWKDSNNISFMGIPKFAESSQWKDLGDAPSLTACKDMSISSSKGPFGSVVFVENEKKCYGGIPNATQQMLKMEGVYSSVPFMGTTNLGGKEAVTYVETLKKLNDTLKELLYKMRREMSSLEQKTRKEQKIITSTHDAIQSDVSKLHNDRKKINEMEETLVSLETKLGILEKVSTREKMIYMGTGALFLVLIAIFLRKYS